ncbi:FxLD family lanthipeptide [Streptomyces sp. NPDC091292]|uniref:FxLD family lanthipeptide n=1 Tax=Streptomyces sp. NPDC091292 TaxID=3365991 RepID=UPI003806B66E
MSPTPAVLETHQAAMDDDFAPLDVKVVVATHSIGKLMCTTGDGCGGTCATNASACNSYVEDPA